MIGFSVVLSGCATPELREEKPPENNLDFSSLKQTAPKGEPAPAETPKQPVAQPLTTKKMYSYPPVMAIDTTKEYTATLKTSAGDITVQLNAKATPTTVNSFVFLAREKFYDGTIFHRTIPGFMIQGGDPQGTGMGGPGYNVVETPSKDTKYDRGVIAMAKTGADPAGTSGSQFFIMHKDYPLPPDYIVFGETIEGLDVVDKIANAPTTKQGGESPVTPVVIESVTINEK